MANNDALIEIAIQIMKEKKQELTINALAKEVFEVKGIKFNEKSDEYAQFQIDFMLCGEFIVCGKDKNDNVYWDLKNRQKLEKQDNDGFDIIDAYEDEEASKNELTGEFGYEIKNEDGYNDEYDQEDEDDEEDEKEEKDDIEEELELTGERVDAYDEEDDVEEDNYDDNDENED